MTQQIILDVPTYLDIIGDGKLDPVEVDRREDIVSKHRQTIGDAVCYKLLDKNGQIADYVWVYIPKGYLTPPGGLSSGHVTGGPKPDPHFGEITEIYFMTPDNGKPPKVGQWNDPDLTVMSMKNMVVDPDTFVAEMSDIDLEKRYSYAVSLFDGADKIRGSKFSDPYLEVGRGGKAIVDGGDGADVLHVWHRKTVDFDGGKGSDTLSFQHVSGGGNDEVPAIGATVDLGKETGINPWGGMIKLTSVENVEGYYLAANTITGDNGANHIASGAYGDTLKGLGGNDTITVQPYFGDAGTVRNLHVDGGAGTDTLIFRSFFNSPNTLDLLHPNQNTGTFANGTFKSIEAFFEEENNAPFTFRGSNAGERVATDTFSTAADVFDGRGGDDTLIGAYGADTLTGGSGADDFRYSFSVDSEPAAPDTITDFSHAAHDRINLSKIYFLKFDFIASKDFGGHAGELHAVRQGSQTRVEADIDGDKTADFAVLLDGAPKLVEGDFAL